MRAPLVFLFLFTSLCLNGQTATKFTNVPARAPQPPIELAHDSHVHQLLANSSVRVYRIDLAAGAETALDRHEHDFLILSLGTSQFEIAGPGNIFPMTMSDSEVQVMKAHWPHRILNKSKNPLHLIEIESTLFITPSIRLAKVEIQPAAGMPEHGHTSSHLMIALNDQQLTNAVVAGQTSPIEAHAGDPTWIGGDIVHRVFNKGTRPARFLTIEWK